MLCLAIVIAVHQTSQVSCFVDHTKTVSLSLRFQTLIPNSDKKTKGTSVDFLVHRLNSPLKARHSPQPAQNPKLLSNNNGSTPRTEMSVFLL